MSVPYTVALNSCRTMPALVAGTGQLDDAAAARVVASALAGGYRGIDTASFYGNEAAIGRAIAQSGVPREELFLTTKLWNDDHGYDRALRALHSSLGRLGVDYVDAYLIHWPVPARDLYPSTWRALIRLRDEGLARSIGVSNFGFDHLRRIIEDSGMPPAVNQIECHPYRSDLELRRIHTEYGITTEAYSPLARGIALADPVITALARRYRRSAAQIVLRWHVQRGRAVVAKATREEHLHENLGIFDFALAEDACRAIDRLDRGLRLEPDPGGFGDCGSRPPDCGSRPLGSFPRARMRAG